MIESRALDVLKLASEAGRFCTDRFDKKSPGFRCKTKLQAIQHMYVSENNLKIGINSALALFGVTKSKWIFLYRKCMEYQTTLTQFVHPDAHSRIYVRNAGVNL